MLHILFEPMQKLLCKRPWRSLNKAKSLFSSYKNLRKLFLRPCIPGTPTLGTPRITKTPQFDFNNPTVVDTDISKSQQDVETFYNMFSKLLDKKIDEIRGVVQLSSTEAQKQMSADKDIPDDYIEAIQPPPSFLHTVPSLVIHFLN